MSVRIERIDKDGNRWAICGNTQADLEMGVSALLASLSRVEEAATHRRVGRPRKEEEGMPTDDGQKERYQSALALLRAIKDGGDLGADASDLAKAVNVQESKALGPLMGMLGRVLTALDLDPSRVYQSIGSSPHRRWFLQPDLALAIQRIEEELAKD